MGAKQYLEQAKRLDDLINAKLEQIDKLRALAEKITTEYTGSEKVDSTHRNDQLARTVAKIVDLEHELNEEIDEAVNLKIYIKRLINQIDNNEYKVLLFLRYINMRTWEEIAEKMNFAVSWIYVKHDKAIEELEKVYKRTE